MPDIVVFDESFVNRAVPFAAFTARKSLFACWNRPRKATFHSTTFQPNSISPLHFMRCLAEADTEFMRRHGERLELVNADLALARRVVPPLLQPRALSPDSGDGIPHGRRSCRGLVYCGERPACV